MYQHDPRHVNVLVKDLGLEQGNSVQTTTRDATSEEPEPSDQVQHSRYRSQVARCLFFIQHRADVTFIVNELCQRMSNPAQQSLAKLKVLVRYVKRERQLGQEFSHVRMVEEVTTFSDSDWAGVILLGSHTLKAFSRKQQIIARSSEEAELCAATMGASVSKNGIASLLKDLGYEMKPVLAIDAKAKEW